ncbi:MAG TPA: AAA family ATPase, partial [Lachnospiraceae bacterium]|nr:AAA family ATPase [Lachnospiraceae bacterium]
MGIYVNPGNNAFEISRYSDIYVDKSMLISKLNTLYKTEKRFLCVSRPRRFGKSMAANMLAAYYSRGCDSAGLFSGLAVQEEKSFQAHLNRHNVIRLDVQRFLRSESELSSFIPEIERKVIAELLREFPECEGLDMCNRLDDALEQIFYQTGKGFIFILDEWDCVFRMAKEQRDMQKRYLDFLRSLFKGAEYAELVYMTGILPIKKYGEHSAINIFDEYSMTDPRGLWEYFGFTEEEVEAECRKRGVDYGEMQKWYDGYLLGGRHIYNPKSVADALTWKEFQSYWTGTETYEALKVYIDRNYDGLKESVIEMLGGGRCRINARKFQNDMTTFTSKDDVMALLIHLGYLTYDKYTGEAFIPNMEIMQEFLDAVDGPGWDGVTAALNRSEEL